MKHYYVLSDGRKVNTTKEGAEIMNISKPQFRKLVKKEVIIKITGDLVSEKTI